MQEGNGLNKIRIAKNKRMRKASLPYIPIGDRLPKIRVVVFVFLSQIHELHGQQEASYREERLQTICAIDQYHVADVEKFLRRSWGKTWRDSRH